MAADTIVASNTVLITDQGHPDPPALSDTSIGAWEIARSRYLQNLTREEQEQFQNASQQSVIDDVKAVETEYRSSMYHTFTSAANLHKVYAVPFHFYSLLLILSFKDPLLEL